MKKLLAGGFAALLGCSLVVLAQEIRRDGKWEVTQEMSMTGMPMQMPATTTTQCITKEETNDPQKTVMQPPAGRGGAQSDCKAEDYKMVGNKVTYTLKCTTPQPITGKAEMVYGADKYDGTMTMEMSRGGQQMTINTKISAKRVGDCVK